MRTVRTKVFKFKELDNKAQGKAIVVKRVNNDTNGNPRYVTHFLNLLNEKDEAQIKEDFAASLALNPFKLTEFTYWRALEKAKQIGGRKFHNKQFGGGIVFQSYNIKNLLKEIEEIQAK